MNQVMENPSPASYLQNTNWLFRESKGTKWTAEENKRFENALAQFDKDTPDRWHRVAAMIPGKTAGDVWKQYKELEEDVSDIEAGLFPIPGYARNSFTLEWVDSHNSNNSNNCHEYDGLRHFYSPGGKRGSSTRPSEQERKKGIPWTEEEHRQFLMGLKKYGKGDWRNISRNFVTSRTPTQVASHAQKYFIRQHTGGNKRRASIHDITTHNLPPDSNESSSRDGNKSPSPSRSTSTLQLPHHHHHHEPSIRMTGFDNQKLQNRDQGSNSSNMFLAPFCGMSSYGQMFQEQNLLRATIGGAQFGPYSSSSTIYQMQSMQHQ